MTDDKKDKVQAPQKEQEQKPEQPKQPTRVDLLEGRVEQLELMVLELAAKVEEAQKPSGLEALAQLVAAAAKNGGKRKPKFGGNTGPKKVKDNKTGIIYDSESKCAKAVALEFGEDPNNHFSWYKFGPQNPDRFEILG